MSAPASRIHLGNFTFDSLYFCGTPVELFRGERFLTAVNDWYMPFIRSGWAVPLAFVIDVAALLLQPNASAFRSRWKEANVRDDLKQLAQDYFEVLQKLKREPVFAYVAELLGTTGESVERDQAAEQRRRDQAVKIFLRFLLAPLAEFRRVYSFNTRDLKLVKASPCPEGLRSVELRLAGKEVHGDFLFEDPAKIKRKHEFATILGLMRALCDYYRAQRLEKIVTPVELLMIEIAARNAAGISRVDYRFLKELLRGWSLSDVEEHTPRPRPIQEVIPTDAYEQNGQVGGYIDVNREVFRGNVAAMLPAEMSLVRNKGLFYQRLINEGSLHYIREDFECIERELRVLFCFVIDTHELMFRAQSDAHASHGRGLTPYIRSRVLATLMVQDLAQYMPRENVHVDFGFYLWSKHAKETGRAVIDLWAWPREQVADRYRFVSRLVDQMPQLFYTRAGGEPAPTAAALDPDPAEYIVNRCRNRRYHCRHLVVFTSRHATGQQWPDVLPETDPGLFAADHTGDSIFVINCDLRHLTLAISRPQNVYGIADDLRTGSLGQLSDERVRSQFLEAVLLKGAGKTFRHEVTELSE